MNIEVGKFYRTRGGEKARIYAKDGGAGHTIHGAILSNGVWVLDNWTVDGESFGLGAQPIDLVSEWKEKVEFEASWENDGSIIFPTGDIGSALECFVGLKTRVTIELL